ncbi:MAG: LysR family transcriptional regulator [Euryarchaeota archaeon]|nr:LysR family transcriptional regulator [Euryarchaeota archaeon]
MKRLKPNFKLWLEADGEPVMGEGRLGLLLAVRESGSLSEGARRVGISYRHAYNLISAIGRRCGEGVVEASVGGARGGGMRLTPAGERLIEDYLAYRTKMEKAVRDLKWNRS